MKLAFWVLAIIILCNLNGAAYMGFGTTQTFNPIIAICCLILLQACLHSVSIKKALGFSGFLIVSALVSYLYIGCFIAFVNASWESYYYEILLKGHLFAIIVIIAAAIGGRAVIRQAGPEPVLKAILVLLTLDCILILASPILSDVYIKENIPGAYTHRFFGTFLDPNGGAGLIGCATAVLALSFFSLKQHRKFAYLALTLGTSAILGTASRTAIISFLCYFFFFFLFNSGLRRFVLKGSVFMILSGVILFNLFFSKMTQYLSRMSVIIYFYRHNFLPETGSSDMRIPILYLALNQIFESPISTIFGLGLGKMDSVENAPINDQTIDKPFGVHNNYLLLWGDSGLIPFTLFLLFFISLFFLLLKISNPVVRNAIFGWVLTIAVFCLTHHIMLLKKTVAFIIGLSCALVGFGNYAGTKQDGVK